MSVAEHPEPHPPDDLVDRLIAINRGYRRARLVEHEYELRFVEGVTPTSIQADILETLLRYTLLTMSDLSRMAGIDPAVASRAIIGLNSLDLVRRGTNAQDRRLVTVSATQKGRKAAQQIVEGRRGFAKSRLSQVPADRQELLLEMLEQYWSR